MAATHPRPVMAADPSGAGRTLGLGNLSVVRHNPTLQ